MIKFYLVVLIALAAASTKDLKGKFIPEKSLLKVKTDSGEVEGLVAETIRLGKLYGRFRGIPYAEPPIKNLRFRPPVPKKNWEDTWNATRARSSCIQMHSKADLLLAGDGFSEDCLYLNIFSPNMDYLENGSGSLKSVMVFIHPGAFNAGSGSDSLFGPDFLLEQDVLVVSFNYRLGALGFLSFHNEDVPGNAGLKDQHLAMKWVKKNIQYFGGDPSEITLHGESAGSASVTYHILSDASKGLFRNAIMQSGSALARWAYSPPKLAVRKARTLSKKVGCAKVNFTAVLECMQKVSVERFLKYQQDTVTAEELFSLRIIAFHPTSEPDVPGAFLVGDPTDLMYSGNFTRVPAIIGLNANEGLLIYPSLTKSDPGGILLSLLGMDLSRFAPYNFHLIPFTKPAVYAHEKISKFYFNSRNLTKSLIWEALELVTDVMFTLPIQLTASLLVDSTVPVYNYYFTYVGKYNVMKTLLNISSAPGACHGDELGYMFYNQYVQTEYANENVSSDSPDDMMIDRITKMWANFAKTGNPTPTLDPQIGCKWEPFSASQSNYLEIGRALVPSENLRMKNMAFWDSLINDLMSMKVEKYVEEEKEGKEDEEEEYDDDAEHLEALWKMLAPPRKN